MNLYIILGNVTAFMACCMMTYSGYVMEKVKLPYVLLKDLDPAGGPLTVSALEEEAETENG